MATLLMIEDDPQIRVLMRKLLATVGSHRLFEATNAHDAMDIVSRERVDLILLDVLLAQNSTGYGFMASFQQRIKSGQIRESPVFLVSGLPQRELEGLVETYPNTIKEMFFKPFDIDHFRNTVASYLPTPLPGDVQDHERQPVVVDQLNAACWSDLRPPVSAS